ncbi:transglutaminase-like domain-containing protein [Microlunatus parietis]|uniref:Transglutaminase-like putative cysteine protease n=1 Tax=Microlunatus parietis TaxID=682979 RepID=A0A7Y9I6H2_9ACTN|nr:transglutaminase-like domain-containing protein [Microlunatus parietis]NYE70945.1 transglutaminase-like putative cysteine protease [Microlunatus parietis]
MILTAEPSQDYLGLDTVIDGDHPQVAGLGAELRAAHRDDHEFARAAFEYVRDEVAHSFDVGDPRVSVTASETLENRVGLCFAKSHLLAALLRGQGIPAALCYQRLTDDGSSHVVHGLVAIKLDGRWHRQDPRGNTGGIDARFSVTGERLAWPVRPELGERDDPRLHATPLPSVITTLRSTDDILRLRNGGLPGDF